jgi:hypothetical protein
MDGWMVFALLGGYCVLFSFRTIGEYCLTRLNGPDALDHYQSILEWQARAWPLGIARHGMPDVWLNSVRKHARSR